MVKEASSAEVSRGRYAAHVSPEMERQSTSVHTTSTCRSYNTALHKRFHLGSCEGGSPAQDRLDTIFILCFIEAPLDQGFPLLTSFCLLWIRNIALGNACQRMTWLSG